MKTESHQYRYPRAALHACAAIIIAVSEAAERSAACCIAELHHCVCAKFDSVIRLCRARSLPDSAARELLYPLAALADETFLSIPQYRSYWSENLLQLRYFEETAAGITFFTRLEKHVTAKTPRKEVLELYFVSLALGLKGMYGVDSAGDLRRRRKIFEDLGDMLRDIRNRGRGAPASADTGEIIRKGVARNAPPVDGRESVISKLMTPVLLYPAATLALMAVAAAVYLMSRAELLIFLSRF